MDGRSRTSGISRLATNPCPLTGGLHVASNNSGVITTMLLGLVLVLSVFALAVAVSLARWVLKQDNGTPEMRRVSDAIQEGAQAFLRRQYRTIGLLSVALAVLIYVLYAFFRQLHPDEVAAGLTPVKLALTTTFSFPFVALFAQLGGGIYTKAADVGADLVGKVEAGIPEDDPRNPAVIADLVGDNVGDCAGRGADLFESTAAENIGAMILGATLATLNAGAFSSPLAVVGVMLFPLVVRAFGLVASIIGIVIVRVKETEDPMSALNRGYLVTAVLAAIGFFAGTRWLLNPATAPDAWWHFFLCGVIGIATSIAFVWITQYYTEYRYRPVKSIARASVTGPATNIIAGFAVALECTALPTFTIGAAIIASYKIGAASGLAHSGLFGTAVATMGMLGTAAYILAMDTFGPITDNAGGVIEMSHQPEEIRRRTDRLDAVGNTTKALTKGYAIGSAALAAFLLFSAFLDEVAALGSPLQGVDISKPEVFVGTLLARLVNSGGGAACSGKQSSGTGQAGGNGAPTHKAAVVGDAVGDPFKDTAGPSLHVQIKLLRTVTLVLAPLFVCDVRPQTS